MTLLPNIRIRRNNMRGKFDIIIDILEIAKKGVNKTSIVYGANLNFRITKKYLALLMENGLMDNREDKYVTTEKGRIILEEAKEINHQLQ
jgi:predicted transcriptional regulator